MTISETSPSTSRPPVPKPKSTKSLELGLSSAAKHTKTEKKLKRHRKDDTIEEAAPEGFPKPEKKSKKRKREAERLPDHCDRENEEDSNRKAKKKLKRAEENQSDPTTTSDVVVPTKKRKNKTGFPDPTEDASLPEQSKKCLAYAFLQFHRPSKWKFNKARQNWILRNIWSNEMIPEAHLPLVYGYLAKVQGGVRENLLQSCRTIGEKSEVEATSSEKAGPVDGTSAETISTPTVLPTPSAAENTKEIRARALIDLLSLSDTAAS